jgi:DNA-binding SARP family transcriptional activator
MIGQGPGRGGAAHARRELDVVPEFDLRVDGRSVPLHPRAQRLIALLAVVPQRTIGRAQAAGLLWPEATAERARSSLRAAVLEVRRADPHLIRAEPHTLMLDALVQVDWHRITALAQSVIASAGASTGTPPGDWECLRHPLLRGWSETWLDLDQSLHDELRVGALEVVSARCRMVGAWCEAVTAATCAVNADPLRESAHRALIEAHLAAGNVAAAARQLEVLSRRLDDELGLRASREVRALVLDAMALSR